MADIRILTAPIGHGKTLYEVTEVCKELKRTDRGLVTNIPLILQMVRQPEETAKLVKWLNDANLKSALAKKKVDDLAELYWTMGEWCHVFVERPVKIKQRLLWLTQNQTREYWRYIPVGEITPEIAQQYKLESVFNDHPLRCCYGYKMPNRPDEQYKELPDFSVREAGYTRGGIYYWVDEAHVLFPARYYQQIGPQVEYYMSQLRKYDDDLDLITQHFEKMDKNFRRNATMWAQVENMSKKRLFMGVSLQKKFRIHLYEGAEQPNKFTKPSKTLWYTLDNKYRYEWLYKTMEGVGVQGAAVAESTRLKGKHWAVWAVPIIVGLLIAWFLPRIVTGVTQKLVQVGAGSLMKGVTTGFNKVAPNTMPTVTNTPVPTYTIPQKPQVRHSPALLNTNDFIHPKAFGVIPEATKPPETLYSTGIVQMGTNIWVLLSDGTTAKSENGEVQGIGTRFVKVFGYDKIPRR